MHLECGVFKKIADEGQPAALAVPAAVVVAEFLQQRYQGGEFAVNIADDVQWSVR